MLVLTRKTKEEIRIGNDITVTIVRVKGQSVRIGINAPDHVHVMRSELAAKSGGPSEGPGTAGRSQRRRSETGDAVNGESPQRTADSPADGPDGVVEPDATATDKGHNRADANGSSPGPNAVHLAGCGCQTERPSLGSTTTFARVVARRRQARTDQFVQFPPR